MLRNLFTVWATILYFVQASFGFASIASVSGPPPSYASASFQNLTISEAASSSDSVQPAELPKRIDVDLTTQTLSYYYGDTLVASIKISSGISALPTPTGTFHVLSKIPVKEFYGHNLDGSVYDFKNTKWNLNFLPEYYIHGAYWNHDMGTPHSHGCINVSYADMEQLYDFADIGTPITIHK